VTIETRHFDVIIVGGGIAGSTLGGVLARSGLGVLVIEKTPRFRDRVRGEMTWPYGVADALALGMEELFHQAGAVELPDAQGYANQQVHDRYAWATDAIDGLSELGFLHPRLQEAAFTWAAAQGATMLRPAKATGFTGGGRATVTVAQEGEEVQYRARLVVGADGKHSMVRKWTGGQSLADPEHHRFGGVLVRGVQSDDRQADNVCWVVGEAVKWFAVGPQQTRLYVAMPTERLRQTGIARSFDAFVTFAAERMPEGALAQVAQAGPIGFFPNHDTWASRIAGDRVVLIGDAAGSPDPTLGHGTALVFHDVRILSEVLLAEAKWEAAIAVFADQRRRVFAAVNAWDRWNGIFFETGDAAVRRREGHERARAVDATLGGWALIEARGPVGLIPDAAARRRFFGEDLS